MTGKQEFLRVCSLVPKSFAARSFSPCDPEQPCLLWGDRQPWTPAPLHSSYGLPFALGPGSLDRTVGCWAHLVSLPGAAHRHPTSGLGQMMLGCLLPGASEGPPALSRSCCYGLHLRVP